MNEDVVLHKEGDYKWVVTDEFGTWPVTINFKHVGWSLSNIFTDGPARVTPLLTVRIRRVEYEIYTEDWPDTTMMTVHVKDQPVDRISIPRGHPAINFFHKTGVGSSGKTETICVARTFDYIRYGTGEACDQHTV